MYCPMKENGFVSNISVRGVLKGEWTKSQVPFIESENCLHGVQYVRTEHLKTTAAILSLTVCFVTVWSSLTVVCDKLVSHKKGECIFHCAVLFGPTAFNSEHVKVKVPAEHFWIVQSDSGSSMSCRDWLPCHDLLGGKQSSQAENINPEAHVAQSSDGPCERAKYSWL